MPDSIKRHAHMRNDRFKVRQFFRLQRLANSRIVAAFVFFLERDVESLFDFADVLQRTPVNLVEFRHVAVVPLDQQLNTWLVGQYRYTLDDYSWEIPEGGCPLGTDPLDTAKRELIEETGIRAQQWEKILDFHTSNSVTDEAGIAYLATGLTFGEAEPEDTEELMIKQLPLAEAIEWVWNGKITDALSIMALQKVALMQAKGLLSI